MKKSNKILTAAAVAGGAVGLTYALNRIIFHYSTMKKLLVSDERFVYEWRFGNIHYIKKGSGNPLILLHDLNSSSSSYEWHRMIDDLAKSHTVYALDLLGCGYSDKPKMTYTNYLYVQMLNDFIKEVVKGKTDVAASVGSCSIAISACHMMPELYHTLMLINPQNPAEVAKAPKFYHKLYKYMIEIPVFGTLLYNVQMTAGNIGKMFEEQYYHAVELVDAMDISVYNEAAHLGGASSRYLYASIRSRYLSIPLHQAIKKIDQSIVIVGGKAVEGIEDVIDVYCELNPAIETVMLDNAKYMPQLEVPEELKEVISIYMG